MLFCGKFGPETSKCFVLNETLYKAVSRVLILYLAFFFVNSLLKKSFGGNLAPKLQTALFKMKHNTKGYSRRLILDSTIAI